MAVPHYRDARMQHSQSRQPALPRVTTAVAPRGVPASTNEVFPASPTQEKTKDAERRKTFEADIGKMFHGNAEESAFKIIHILRQRQTFATIRLHVNPRTCLPNKHGTHLFPKTEVRCINQVTHSREELCQTWSSGTLRSSFFLG